MEKFKPYWHFAASFFLFLICFYAGAKGLADNSLAFDEPFSVLHSQLSIKNIIAELSKGNNPPLYEVLLHFWTKIFGINVFSVRLLSNLFMSIAVILIFQTGRLFTNKVAWLAGILFIFSNYQTAFASESRVYALFVLLTSISMFSFTNLVKGKKEKYWTVILVATNILLVYSHFFGFFVWFIQILSILIIKEIRISLLKPYLKIMGICTIFYIPYIYIFITRFYLSAVNGTWVAPVSNLYELHNFILLFTNKSLALYVIILSIVWFSTQRFIFQSAWNNYIKYSLILISVYLFVFSFSVPSAMPYYFFVFCTKSLILFIYIVLLTCMVVLVCSSPKLSALFKVVFIWFFIPILIMFVSSFRIPMFLDRYVIYTLPAFYLLLSVSVFEFDNEFQYPLAILLVTLMIITSVRNVENCRDVRNLVAKTKEIKVRRSVLYICPDYFDQNFIYYYNQDYFKNATKYYPFDLLRKQINSDMVFPITNYRDMDTSLFSKVDKVIFLDAAADFTFPNNGIYTFLHSRFKNEIKYEYINIFRLYEFKTTGK